MRTILTTSIFSILGALSPSTALGQDVTVSARARSELTASLTIGGTTYLQSLPAGTPAPLTLSALPPPGVNPGVDTFVELHPSPTCVVRSRLALQAGNSGLAFGGIEMTFSAARNLEGQLRLTSFADPTVPSVRIDVGGDGSFELISRGTTVVPVSLGPSRDVIVHLDYALANLSSLQQILSQTGIVSFEHGPASYTTFGTGCPGSNGTPTLSATGAAPITGTTFSVDATQLPTTGPTFGLFGFSEFAPPLDLGVISMDGCLLHVDPAIAAVPLTTTGGSATWALAIPVHVPLGLVFFQQLFVIDPTANPLGATVSNAGRGVIGAN